LVHHALYGEHLVCLDPPLQLLISWLWAGNVGSCGQSAAVTPLRVIVGPVLQDPSHTHTISVVDPDPDPDPQGSETFCRIRIRNWT
jgi:hypothetical protein